MIAIFKCGTLGRLGREAKPEAFACFADATFITPQFDHSSILFILRGFAAENGLIPSKSTDLSPCLPISPSPRLQASPPQHFATPGSISSLHAVIPPPHSKHRQSPRPAATSPPAHCAHRSCNAPGSCHRAAVQSRRFGNSPSGTSLAPSMRAISYSCGSRTSSSKKSPP